ncbi:hypothetical protein ACFPRL_34965, partial [Pseudoclavibacter helvolus]
VGVLLRGSALNSAFFGARWIALAGFRCAEEVLKCVGVAGLRGLAGGAVFLQGGGGAGGFPEAVVKANGDEEREREEESGADVIEVPLLHALIASASSAEIRARPARSRLSWPRRSRVW